MVTDALVEADIAWNRKLSKSAMDPESYQGLTDGVLRTIEFAPNEDGHLDKAKAIVKRIRKRNLYVCFPSSRFDRSVRNSHTTQTGTRSSTKS